MKEILEKIDNVIRDLETMNSLLYNGEFKDLAAVRKYLIGIKTELEKWQKVTITDPYKMSFLLKKEPNDTIKQRPFKGSILEKQMQDVTDKMRKIKIPKISINDRIEFMKNSKEKPTTGDYSESELRSLEGNIFVIPKDFKANDKGLLINNNNGSFVIINRQADGFVLRTCENKNIPKIGIGVHISTQYRLPTKREKAIFYEFYPEYCKTEPEKLDLSKLKVGDFVFEIFEKTIYEIIGIDKDCRLVDSTNDITMINKHSNYDYIRSCYRLATEPEISNYINRPIDVSSLKVGDMLWWKLENIIKVDKIKNEWLYIESLGSNHFNPYHLSQLEPYFRYPTQKEINEYLAEQKSKPESLEIVNPKLLMLLVEKRTNKIRKINHIHTGTKYPYYVSKIITAFDLQLLNDYFRLPTETELKAYNEKKERKQAKRI